MLLWHQVVEAILEVLERVLGEGGLLMVLTLLVSTPRVIRNGAGLVDRLLLLFDEVAAQIGKDSSIVVLGSNLVTLVREDGAPESG